MYPGLSAAIACLLLTSGSCTVQITPYQEDEVVLVVSPGHPMAGAGQVEVADLRHLRFVSLQKSSTVQGIRNILQGHGVVWSSLQVVMVRCRCRLIMCQARPSGHKPVQSWMHRMLGAGSYCDPAGRHPNTAAPAPQASAPPSPTLHTASHPRTPQEVNSVEAIKNAVEVGLGAAFVSRSAVDKEVALGRLAVLTVRGVPLRRTLLCVTDPVRYCSQAVRAFIQEMFGLTIETSASGCFLPGQVCLSRFSSMHVLLPLACD